MKDGGPAFPCNSPDGTESYKGMSLRDYFAAKAMQALIATRVSVANSVLYCNYDVSYEAYEIAGAMLAEREK